MLSTEVLLKYDFLEDQSLFMSAANWDGLLYSSDGLLPQRSTTAVRDLDAEKMDDSEILKLLIIYVITFLDKIEEH